MQTANAAFAKCNQLPVIVGEARYPRVPPPGMLPQMCCGPMWNAMRLREHPCNYTVGTHGRTANDHH